MVGKVRVYELARELGMDDSKPLMKILRDMGYDVKTASNTLPNDAVRKIREVVAPHIETLRREAEQQAAKEQAAKAKEAAKAKAPVRVVRVVSKATTAEKEAILDRHRRKLAGEEITESAGQAKQNIYDTLQQAAPAPVEAAEPVVEETAVPAVVAEAPPAPEAVVAPVTPPVAETPGDDDRSRQLPPDQQIAAEYRDRTAAPPPPPPPQAERPAAEGPRPQPAGTGGGPPGFRKAPVARDISPSRPRKPMRPAGPQRPVRGKNDRKKRPMPKGSGPRVEQSRGLELPEIITVQDLAARLGVPASDVIKTLIREGQMVTMNQPLDYEMASRISRSYGFEVSESADELPADELLENEEVDVDAEDRPPVVTVLGHVDHGKTSLLDAIRKTEVTATEAGGITQRIGAYTVNHNDQTITFIDTPGHEAFTAMRARGAGVTDIAILVVAADDGVMPTTIEAINHAKAAKVPIIVAVNKIDKPNANPERVLQQLTEYHLVPEAWGGDTVTINVSAINGENIQELLDMVLLVAEVQELKANPGKMATGTIIEGRLDKGLGPVATVLVQGGTLKVGDVVVVGTTSGRVRMLQNENGQKIREAGPSFPAEIIGLPSVPLPGDHLQVVEDERMAKQVAQYREEHARTDRIKASGGRTGTLESLFGTAAGEEAKELKVVVKADEKGALEAICSSLEKLSTDEVKLQVVHQAVGAIRESDVLLASASSKLIIGFNVRPDPAVKRAADQEGVEIRLYRVIYTMLDEIRKAMAGLLAPDISSEELGRVEVRQIFKVTKVGKVAGCHVTEGKITRDAEVRVVRDGVQIYEGRLESLKRFKDDAKEVAAGYDCGLSVLNYPDLQEGDVIEAFRKIVTIREDL